MHDHRSSINTALGCVVRSILAVGLVGTLPTVNAQAQEPPTPQPTVTATDSEVIPVAVVFMVGVAKEGDDAEVKAEFERQFPGFAEEHGLLEVDTTGEPELTFRLQLQQLESGAADYLIYSTAIYHDNVYTDVERTCLNCSPADVVANALTNLAKAAEAVVESRAKIAAAKAASEEAVEVPVAPPPPPRVRVLGAASWVGIASTALGLGAGISGAVLLDRGVVVEPDPFNVTSTATDYRQAGIALAGVDLGLMVVGNVLIGVDLGVLLPRRRARAQARLDGVSLAVAGSPGLAVLGRF